MSKENLGEKPALIAGASLLVDYVLTVAVSISAGVAAITSAVPELRDQRVPLCLGFIAVLMLANLRGLKESGTVFAVPTYVYIVSLGGLIAYGLYRVVHRRPRRRSRRSTERYDEFTDGAYSAAPSPGSPPTVPRGPSPPAPSPSPASRPSPTACPPSASRSRRNAAKTLIAMGVILAVVLLLASRCSPTGCSRRCRDDETILSLIAAAVYGDGSFLYYVLQISTMAILLLAANTAYADFPRIASILAARRLPAASAAQPRRPARLLQRHHRPVGHRRRC